MAKRESELKQKEKENYSKNRNRNITLILSYVFAIWTLQNRKYYNEMKDIDENERNC